MNVTKYFIAVQILLFICTHASASHSLIDYSPFSPPGKKQVVKKTLSDKIPEQMNKFSLQGLAIINNAYIFSVHDHTTEKAEWLSPNETINGFSIRRYDPRSMTIFYEWNGNKGSARINNSSYNSTEMTSQLHDSSSQTSTASSMPQTDEQNRSNTNNPRTDLRADKTYQYTKNGGIIFSDYRSNTDRPSLTSGTLNDNQNGFATGSVTNEAPTTNPENLQAANTLKPFKISRRNSVNNPNGKTPDHLR